MKRGISLIRKKVNSVLLALRQSFSKFQTYARIYGLSFSKMKRSLLKYVTIHDARYLMD